MVSFTITVCVQLAVLLLPSVTVHTTLVVPTGYVVDGWLLVTEATEQLSFVIGVPSAATVTVAAQPDVTFTVTLAGHVIVGLVLSFNDTRNEHVEKLPEASVTVNVTVVFVEIIVPAAGDCVIIKLELFVQLSSKSKFSNASLKSSSPINVV
jgi:uncharacterized protein YkvS